MTKSGYGIYVKIWATTARTALKIYYVWCTPRLYLSGRPEWCLVSLPDIRHTHSYRGHVIIAWLNGRGARRSSVRRSKAGCSPWFGFPLPSHVRARWRARPPSHMYSTRSWPLLWGIYPYKLSAEPRESTEARQKRATRRCTRGRACCTKPSQAVRRAVVGN